MPELDVLVPYATKNYVTNPSFEVDSTGWTAVGASISVVMTRARFERKALQVVTTGAGIGEGVYFRINDTTLKGVVFGSIYVRGEGKIRIKVKDGLTGRVSHSLSVDLHDDYWQRIHVQGYAEGTDDTRLYVETVESSQAVTFYIDGAQVERTDYLSTYCDGYQPDCRWNGVKNASTSQRSATSPNGGRWVNIRDDECDPTTYITTFSGMGLPPITINRQQMALTPGSFFDSLRTNERVIQLTVNIKDDYAQRRSGLSKLRLNQLRQHLIDLVKPDRDPNTEPMWLRYREGDRALLLRAVYESGLEFDGDFRNKWINSIPLRFLALDPFWYEDDQEVHLLDTENPTGAKALAAKIDGDWVKLGQDLNVPQGMTYVEGVDGTIYMFGTFTQDGNGNALNYFAYYDDDANLIRQAGGGFNGYARNLAVHPNGKIYIVGDFTSDASGVPVYNRVVEYDPDTDSFAAMGTGLNDTCYNVSIAPNGDVYVCGDFTDAGGTLVWGVARWDGGAWHAVGDPITDLSISGIGNAEFYSLLVKSQTEVYMFGYCLTSGIDIFAYQYDGSTWTLMGSQATFSQVLGIEWSAFDTGGNIWVTDWDGLYKWNGSSWETIYSPDGSNRPFTPYSMFIDDDDNIYFAGQFTTTEINDVSFSGAVAGIYNGSVFARLDIAFNRLANTRGNAFIIRSNGDIFVGLRNFSNGVSDMTGSGTVEIVSRGTAVSFPIVSFEGSGKIIWLENQSAKLQTYLDYQIQENELLEIDFRIGKKTAKSNYRGNVLDAILPESADLFLLPNTGLSDVYNKIGCLVVDEVNPTVQLRYQPTHWSVDAIANQ